MDTKELLEELASIAQRINTLRASLEGSAPVDVESAESKIRRGVCTYCGKPIGPKQPQRGAHQNCYKTSRRRIEQGKTTDDQMVRQGLLLPPGTPGPKVSSEDPVEQLRLKRLAEESDPTLTVGKKRGRKTKEPEA